MPSSYIGFNRPTTEELYNRITSDINNSLPEQDALLANSPLNILATTVTGAFTELYAYMDWMSNQTNILYATGNNLDHYGQIWGISRLVATAATGYATFTGENGYGIPTDTLMQTSNGAQYITTEEVVLTSWSQPIAITSVTTGKAGNLAEFTQLTLVNPVSGIIPTLSVNSMAGGADSETDELYRARILNRIKNPPFGGTASDYYSWMMNKAGVTRAWVKPLMNGAGTVGLYFAMDNTYMNGIPSPAEVVSMQEYINTVKPITADVTVYAPTEYPIDFNLTDIYPDTLTTRTNITNELTALLLRKGAPGEIIYASDIWQAISLATGIQHHNYLSFVDIIVPAGSIPVLGTITWSGPIV